jgi:hypothetical protein
MKSGNRSLRSNALNPGPEVQECAGGGTILSLAKLTTSIREKASVPRRKTLTNSGSQEFNEEIERAMEADSA